MSKKTFGFSAMRIEVREKARVDETRGIKAAVERATISVEASMVVIAVMIIFISTAIATTNDIERVSDLRRRVRGGVDAIF
jgi:hypothetical protein